MNFLAEPRCRGENLPAAVLFYQICRTHQPLIAPDDGGHLPKFVRRGRQWGCTPHSPAGATPTGAAEPALDSSGSRPPAGPPISVRCWRSLCWRFHHQIIRQNARRSAWTPRTRQRKYRCCRRRRRRSDGLDTLLRRMGYLQPTVPGRDLVRHSGGRSKRSAPDHTGPTR